MTAPNLNTLPTDILFLISQYLSPATLQNLALVDKQSHAAACNTLFHSVTIRTATLQTDIDQWNSTLLRNSAMGMVRCLRVDGGPENFRHTLSSHTPGFGGMGADLSPLDGFLDQLTALTKLVWDCAPQVPESVLDFIHSNRPSCQLHLERFRLYSVFNTALLEYEQRLVSSPNLHTIRCRLEQTSHHRILLHVLGLAPNLKVLKGGKATSCLVYLNEAVKVPEDSPWLQSTSGAGHLRLDRLWYDAPLDGPTISKWMAAITPSTLRCLDLGGCWGGSLDPKAFDQLHACDFHNLGDFSMHLSIFDDDKALSTAAKRFLCNQRPLAALKITGSVDRTFLDPVLEVHGSRLRELKLLPAVGYYRGQVYLNQVSGRPDDVVSIVSRCPVIEDFTTHIPRTQGNMDEVNIYRALGAAPRLQCIKLKLDASYPKVHEDVTEDHFPDNDGPRDPDIAEFDNELLDDFDDEEDGPRPCKGHVRKALIDSAVDANLACSIWNVIASSKPPGSLHLESLQLIVKPGKTILETANHICSTVAQSWGLQRKERDDRRGEVVGTPLSRQYDPDEEFNPKHSGLYRHNPDHDDNVRHDWNTIGPVFRRVWPSREGDDGSTGWKERWMSLPLEV